MRPFNPLRGSLQIYSISAVKKGPEDGGDGVRDAKKPRAPKRMLRRRPEKSVWF